MPRRPPLVPPWPPPHASTDASAASAAPTAFVSYSHADRRRVAALIDDLGSLAQPAWWDTDLVPGQRWWDEICQRVRDCGLFIFALSVASNHSAACRRELEYALALHKPVLPVLVGEDVPVSIAPDLAAIQFADLRGPRRRGRAALGRALEAIRRAPTPPPAAGVVPPPAPIADLGGLPERVAQRSLSAAEQHQLVDELMGRLSDPIASDAVIALLGELAQRRDLDRAVRREIDAVLRDVEDDEKKRRLLLIGVPGSARAEAAERPPSPWRRRAGWMAGAAAGVAAIVGVGFVVTNALAPEGAPLSPSLSAIDFAQADVGTESGPWTVDMTNETDRPVHIRTVTVSGDLAPEVRVAGCAGSTLPPTESCAVDVWFAPQQRGSRTGRLEVVSNRGDVVVALSGTGVVSGAITADPPQLTFDALHPGGTASRTITLTNSGTDTAVVHAVRATGAARETMSFAGCEGAELAPGASCQLVVTVAPTRVGAWNGAVEVASNGQVVATVTVSGTTVGLPRLAATPSAVQFDAASVGTTSTARQVRVDNDGNGPTQIESVSRSGAQPDDFSVEGCSAAELDPGKSCTLSIRFAPTEAGSRSAVVAVRGSNGADVTVDVQGSGLTPGVAEVSTNAVRFGDTQVGTISKLMTVDVTNTGGGVVHLASTVVDGPQATDFTVTGCQDAKLEPRDSCRLSVTMKPRSSGPRSAVLHVNEDTGTGPTIALTGVGYAVADLSVSVNRTASVTVVNLGPNTADSLHLTITADNLRIVTADGCTVDAAGGAARCSRDQLEPGTSQAWVVQITTDWMAEGSVRVTATITSDARDPAPENNRTAYEADYVK